MPLLRCSEQRRQSLEEFYSGWTLESNPVSVRIGEAMLAVVAAINTTFVETKIYGLTSHAHLLLCPEDHVPADWYISLIANGQEYCIEYKMTKAHRPWEGAVMKGATKSPEEFRRYIIIALFECGGWGKSTELERLYKDVKTANTKNA